MSLDLGDAFAGLGVGAYAAVHETNGQVLADGYASAAYGMPAERRIINMHTGVCGGRGGGARSCFGRLCVFQGGPVRPPINTGGDRSIV